MQRACVVRICNVTAGGRKRVQTGEIGRMTRSVRQHMDAPLELLHEIPQLRVRRAVLFSVPFLALVARGTVLTGDLIRPQNNPLKHPLPALGPAIVNATTAAAALFQAPADGVASAHLLSTTSEPSPQLTAATASATVSTAGPDLLPGSQRDLLLTNTVPSDEQLEMALDDLPMLDSDEDLPFDSLLEDQVPPAVPVPPVALTAPTTSATPATETVTAAAKATTVSASVDEPVENTAESAEGEDDDASNSSSGSDNDDNGSAVSGSSMPSLSPQTSPMMSRSPSP